MRAAYIVKRIAIVEDDIALFALNRSIYRDNMELLETSKKQVRISPGNLPPLARCAADDANMCRVTIRSHGSMSSVAMDGTCGDRFAEFSYNSTTGLYYFG